MQALLALMRKDLVLYFSNRRAVLMSIVAPILIAAFFGSLFGGGNDKPANIAVGVTDLDRSALSARVVASLRSDSALSVREAPEADAIAQVRAGTLRAARDSEGLGEVHVQGFELDGLDAGHAAFLPALVGEDDVTNEGVVANAIPLNVR